MSLPNGLAILTHLPWHSAYLAGTHKTAMRLSQRTCAGLHEKIVGARWLLTPVVLLSTHSVLDEIGSGSASAAEDGNGSHAFGSEDSSNVHSFEVGTWLNTGVPSASPQVCCVKVCLAFT